VLQLQVRANFVPSSLILSNDGGGDMFLDTLVLTRATRRRIPEDDILQSHRLENLKSYERSASLRIMTAFLRPQS
jgi:hypothetical protein